MGMSFFLRLLSLLLVLGQAHAAELTGINATQPKCGALYSLFQAQAESAIAIERRLRSDFSHFTAITTTDNRAFIRLSREADRGKPGAAKLFFDVENAILKLLNDKIIQDKDLVSALTNFHKNVLWERIERDPILSSAVVQKYSDFKSIRLAFNRDDPEFQKRLSTIVEEANSKFEDHLAPLTRDRNWTETDRGEIRTANWHLAGTGRSPDEAGLSARHARRHLEDSIPAPLYDFSKITEKLAEKTKRIENLRKQVATLLSGVPGALTQTSEGKQVLSAEAFETLRKVSPKSPTHAAYVRAAQEDFKQRFGRNLSPDEATQLRDYVASVDLISPGIYAEERVVIDLAKARLGVISADFKGQNAKNLEETAKALAQSNRMDLQEQIRRVRNGEEIATRGLEIHKEHFGKAIEQFFQSRKDLYFSGDDGIFMPSRALNDQDKKEFLKTLMTHGPPDRFRITFVPHQYAESGNTIPKEALSELIVDAESIEKTLRKQLVTPQNRQDLNHTLIAIDFTPHETQPPEVSLYFERNDGRPVPQGLLDQAAKLVKANGYRLKLIQAP